MNKQNMKLEEDRNEFIYRNIDTNWFNYLIGGNTLIALLIFTNLNSYQEILDKYEGYSLEELLNEILNNI